MQPSFWIYTAPFFSLENKCQFNISIMQTFCTFFRFFLMRTNKFCGDSNLLKEDKYAFWFSYEKIKWKTHIWNSQSENIASILRQQLNRKRRHVIKTDLLKKAPLTINENENPRGYCLETVSGKTFTTRKTFATRRGGVKGGFRVPNPTLVWTDNYKLSWWFISNRHFTMIKGRFFCGCFMFHKVHETAKILKPFT